MDHKHRGRGENWTAEEKEILIDIMKSSARIIECKNTDTNTNKRKQAEWFTVQKKFQELTGKLRDVAQLKGYWRRARMTAKKNVFKHKRALQGTGGGEKPPSPSQEEQKIMEMCPTDFVTEENVFDSDGVFYNQALEDKNQQTEEIVDLVCTAGPSNYNPIVLASKPGNISLLLDVKEDTLEEDENMSTPHRPQKSYDRMRKHCKTEKSHKASIVETNADVKQKMFSLMEEEYALKLKYQRRELSHQELRHKLEIELLIIEKEKKELELKLLKKSF